MRMRREFPAAVKLAAWQRCQGRCEQCTAKLYPGRFRYDHDKPDAFGGPPTLENCKVRCDNCDNEKTYKHDIPAIAKSNRVRKRHAGIKKPRRTIPGRKFDGTPIPAKWAER